MQFSPFPKLARLNRDIVVTEKLDGTNAQIVIYDATMLDPDFVVAEVNGLGLCAGSRTRYIVPGNDNFGFAAWVQANAQELVGLGVGQHFGEWWGKGIQRGYGMTDRKFSLFNTPRWYDDMNHKKLCPDICDVVPILYKGDFSQGYVQKCVEELRLTGSRAMPGYKNPEGVVVYHTAANTAFKVTCENDNKPKSCQEKNGVAS